QESIFSGLNNITVNTIMDDEYSEYFGFTSDEVKRILRDFKLLDRVKEVEEWYDGYVFGSTEIYNPWSVINYVSKKGIPQAYWASAGKNEILEEVLSVATDDINDRLNSLLKEEKVVAKIDQNVVYRSLIDEPANIYSLLMMAGYLKTTKRALQLDGTYLCEIEIPNKEIAAVYKIEIISRMVQTGAIRQSTADKIAESLYSNNHDLLQNALMEYMHNSMSFYDAGAEGFYHGLTLGLVALMDNQYRIKSNRESGVGRFDLGLFPRQSGHPGIIMEFKWEKNLVKADLVKLAEEALEQINDRDYACEMKDLKIDKIVKIGIAFSGKNVEVVSVS
ncbi:MAG: PD-(D/E)XK nuclease domain-containing protein, partial [Pseudobutyrivibrio sp.]|nr:PD-(D/E)XK nuclease domain-containing protein [Pseudobutyrivibrio sp.]